MGHKYAAYHGLPQRGYRFVEKVPAKYRYAPAAAGLPNHEKRVARYGAMDNLDQILRYKPVAPMGQIGII